MKTLNELKKFKPINKFQQTQIKGGSCLQWVCDQSGNCKWEEVDKTNPTIDAH